MPRLTHYLHGPGLKARWVHNPAPDLQARIRELRIDPGDDHLRATVQSLPTHPLPDQGPPWDLWLLHGHAPDRYAICYRAHHTSHDGAGLISTLGQLFGAATTATPQSSPSPTAGLATYARVIKGMLTSIATNGIWDSPDRPLTGTRVSNWAQVPTHRLRTAATLSGSSNDAFLAALAGALRTWSAEHWPPAADRPLPAAMMVNLRSAEEQDRPGNLFTFAPVPLPCHRPTPAGRLVDVLAATRAVRSPEQRNAMRTLMDLTPARAFYALATQLTTPARAILDTSYINFRSPLHYRGDPVTHIQTFTWLPRSHPASIAACSYNGTTSVYFATDAALPGLHRLPALWTEAVEALAAPQ
ncbi:wax ester/triacylglycerol synthase domain-containing protein [Streptomyces sp. NPDC040750]|uniref:wax ester/triacylglycerol synthase domain-containing protein n=1 Tax=Streptomyces sp. NPDC040750 TaxID=3154491 RepID=UPI00340CC6C0